ncbi:hypothetical protein GLX27_000381 [Malassezia furfur]|uniref:BZIP domain-containing protein n=1 Tax=Malassezia furfur TaxID=55194 RepID=A0ABY8EJ48_MALFU|nr:hypothetical protein CBS14141_001937 [Malassezia furfur]WFD45757.1 hypothetical protein GLX27_000381 [Malassezia furfur]
MATEDHNSISFILGLNQFQEPSGTENVEAAAAGDTNPLLAGLNLLPSASPENAEDTMTNFANQLSLWTNASFNFDGPMGHALIGDEEKEPPKNDGQAHRDDDEKRMQRFLAASGAHSNAARDKNRELDRENRLSPSGAPLPNAPAGETPAPSAFGTGAPFANDLLHTASPGRAFAHAQPHAALGPHDTNAWRASSADRSSAPAERPDVPVAPAPAPAPGADTTWDLTSTLALQYLLSKNPGVLQNLPHVAQGAGALASVPSAPSVPPAPSVPGPSTWNVPAPAGTRTHPNSGYSTPHAPVDPYQLLHAHSSPAPAPAASGAQSSSSSLSLGESSRLTRPAQPTPPSTEFTFSPPGDTRKPVAGSKRSSSSSQGRNGSGKAERAPESEDEPHDTNSDGHKAEDRRNGRGASATERLKLVNTGNPEADAEANRLAIEEDKRRRNTAASARFRVKKKQREAALEMTARELEAQVGELKQINERLRTENEWLKRLITARPEGLSALLGSSMPPAPQVTQPARPPVAVNQPIRPAPPHMPMGKETRDAHPE